MKNISCKICHDFVIYDIYYSLHKINRHTIHKQMIFKLFYLSKTILFKHIHTYMVYIHAYGCVYLCKYLLRMYVLFEIKLLSHIYKYILFEVFLISLFFSFLFPFALYFLLFLYYCVFMLSTCFSVDFSTEQVARNWIVKASLT